MKNLTIKAIIFYQRWLSPHRLFNNPSYYYPSFFNVSGCRFYPSCSEYTKQAVKQYGVLKGLLLGGFRILRCAPWNEGGVDEVK